MSQFLPKIQYLLLNVNLFKYKLMDWTVSLREIRWRIPLFLFKRLNRWTTGRNYPQVNLEDPLEGPQEEDDSDPFEAQKLEIILSGFRPPQ